jgi:hypothetical protein
MISKKSTDRDSAGPQERPPIHDEIERLVVRMGLRPDCGYRYSRRAQELPFVPVTNSSRSNLFQKNGARPGIETETRPTKVL